MVYVWCLCTHIVYTSGRWCINLFVYVDFIQSMVRTCACLLLFHLGGCKMAWIPIVFHWLVPRLVLQTITFFIIWNIARQWMKNREVVDIIQTDLSCFVLWGMKTFYSHLSGIEGVRVWCSNDTYWLEYHFKLIYYHVITKLLDKQCT